MSEHPRTATGLRERKKAKTFSAIRRHALELFRAQGYAATTTEQIAAAAEVSQATLFRYFPTKEDLVLKDDLDSVFVEALRSQPAELSPIQALRNALRAGFELLTPEEAEQQRERMELVREIPELYPGMLSQLSNRVRRITAALAERTGRDPDDFAVRNLSGALVGVSISVLLTAIEEPGKDYMALFDQAVAHLEAGLPL
ncbi:MAG TPA: TetR family transcriptional regulator [Actinocrinis sp.]|nr:TetR family transcriptional regulator [Actinocrinis sp.]